MSLHHAEREHLGFYLKRINDIFKADANFLLRPLNLTYSQLEFLVFLFERQGELTTQKDLERYFNLKHPTVIGTLQRMERKRLITMTVNKSDRRYRNIALTEKALEAKRILQDNIVTMEEKLSGSLSKNQYDQFLLLLKTVYDNLIDNRRTNDPNVSV